MRNEVPLEPFNPAYFTIYRTRIFSMRLIHKAFLIATLCMGISVGAIAQTDAIEAEMAADIEAMRSIIQTERKILILQEMSFTDEEAAAFWPLYDEYRAEAKKIGDLRVKVIVDYAAAYETMTDAIAKQLLNDSVKFEEQSLRLKKKYIKKFEKILPATKVTRYFQLENKLDAVVNYDLAAEIPLMQ